MTTHAVHELTARNGDVALEGTLWLPGAGSGRPVALLTMHPGSGPSDRHNDVFFPPIRDVLLRAGIAVASFDKRGVGGSGGSWLDIGIEEQARDLLAAHAVACAVVSGVPAGVFGHSQGGWVVLEALRASRADAAAGIRPAFGVTSSGPGVATADQERFAAEGSAAGLSHDVGVREHAVRAAWAVIAMFDAGDSYAALASWVADADNADDVALLHRMYGEDLFDRSAWHHLVRLAAFDPVPAMEAVDVPLLAVFGSRDSVTPVEASIRALRAHVAPDLLRVAVVTEGNHRIQAPGTGDFAPGYPDLIVDFIAALLDRSPAAV